MWISTAQCFDTHRCSNIGVVIHPVRTCRQANTSTARNALINVGGAALDVLLDCIVCLSGNCGCEARSCWHSARESCGSSLCTVLYLVTGAISIVGKAFGASRDVASIRFAAAPHFRAATKCAACPVVAVGCCTGTAANEGALANVLLRCSVTIVTCIVRSKTARGEMGQWRQSACGCDE